MIKRHTFENGFQVVYQKSEQTIPLTCIHVFCNVGSAFEIDPIRGASHLVEHMCFKGTKDHSKPRNLLMEYNKVGAYFNAYTEKRYTTYTLTCDDTHIEHCTTLLSDMLLNSSFSRKEFDKEQHVVVEENIRTKDNDGYMLEKALDAIYFNGSSYQHPIDIIDYHPNATYLHYEDIYQWYKWFYHPANMICSIVSNVPFQKIIAFLKKTHFMNMKALSPAEQYLYPVRSLQSITDHFVYHRKKGLSAVILHVGFRTCSYYSDDMYAIKVLKHIMNGFSGRLFTAFRTKRGLTYRSSANTLYHEHTGYFNFHIQTDPKKLMEDEQHDGVLQILLDVIKDLKENGVTPKEVEVAKGNCKGGSLLDLQSIDTLANYNGVAAVLKKDTVVFNDVYKTYIESITYQQVNRVIKKYMIYSNLVVGIVHDHAIPKKKIESMCQQYIN
jgi:hypothetical protein